ncbi:MAG: hypothetical protein AAB227_03915 [Pseudomonadota bacterium]
MKQRAFILPLALLAGCSVTPADPAGAWGGDHISLIVGESGAEIESDCAHGRIDVPFVVDAAGAFALSGVWSSEHGGPLRVGEEEAAQPARYTGKIAGKAMSLTIYLSSPPTRLGPFALVKDRAPNLLKCL